MASKREEERNEKIIRGLMKLPPNRRCINCNNLGPQYVCTNFWTFVCMICSGIHREFTHRVKSVSMSKFTSEEVDALQNGGNQRAREIYLKDWGLQQQRLPNSGDVNKVREFIKAVYVDRKYAGGNKSEKPPRDMQGEREIADETRRASSYHSYSQSPPYDFQYEDRLNRKQGGSINRKPGLFGRKAASFVYSPGRFSDHVYEDRFANEGSSSRVSDYSVSSGGDPFRSAPQSPNLQMEDDFSSSTSDSSRVLAGGLQRHSNSTNSEAVSKKDADRIPVPRPQLGIPVTTSAPAINLFQASTPVDLFQSPEVFSGLPQNTRAPQTSVSSSLSFFPEIFKNSYAPNFNQKLPELSEPVNEGWATFESHQPPDTSILTTADSGSQSEVGISAKHLDSVSSSNAGLQWPNVHNTNLHEPASLTPHLWNEDLKNPHVSTIASSQPWKAFEEVDEKEHKHVEVQGMDLQFSSDQTSCTPDQFLGLETSEICSIDGLQKHVSNEGFSFPTLPPHVPSGFLFNHSIHPFVTDVADVGEKSRNPFDAPFDSEFEGSNVFLGMSNLQVALPSMPLSSPYTGGLDESCFSPHPIGSQGGMSYIAAQAPSTQLTNAPAHGPVAPIGGNPFA